MLVQAFLFYAIWINMLILR